MVRKPWDPVDADQSQFMQENAQQISNATVANGTGPAVIPPTPAPITTPTPATPVWWDGISNNNRNPDSYQALNQLWVEQGQIDYYNPQNEDAILKGIFAGTPLSVKSPVIDKARERYAKYNVLSSLTPDQLWDNILSWKISIWSNEINDMKTFNPDLFLKTQEYVQNKKNLWQINDMWMWIYNAMMKGTNTSNKVKYDVSDSTAPVSDLMVWYNQKIQDMVDSQFWPNAQKRYWLTQELLNNPQIQAQKNTITTLEWQKNKLNEAIFNLDSEVRKVLWSEAPESLVSAYIGEQTKAITKSLRTVDNNLTVEQANLDNYLNEVNTTLGYLKTWWDQDIKKKTGWSGTAQLWSWIESLYNDWKSWAILDKEITNQTIWNKYWLKWMTRQEVLSALSDLMSSEEDLWVTSDLLQRAWWDYATVLGEFTYDKLASNRAQDAINYVKSTKNSTTDRAKSFSKIFKNTDIWTVEAELKKAWISWLFSWKRRIIKEVKKAQWL